MNLVLIKVGCPQITTRELGSQSDSTLHVPHAGCQDWSHRPCGLWPGSAALQPSRPWAEAEAAVLRAGETWQFSP